MENTDVDMVISIPDTPDRPVRRGSVSREVKRRPHSPEAPVRYQREECRNSLNGRIRPVPEIRENGEHCDARTVNRHHSRASGSNALFRRTAVEKDKGKSISTDHRMVRVESNPVLNLNQRNRHAHVITESRCLPSEGIRELHTNDACSPLRADHSSLMLPGNSNKGKEKADCGSVSNIETIDLSSDKQHKRGTKRLVRNGCISPHGIAARSRQVAGINLKDPVIVEPEIAPETVSSIGIREIVSENDIFGRSRGRRPDISSGRVASSDGSEGWVNTRNREFNMDREMNQMDMSDTRGICSSVSRLDVHETIVSEREARQQRRRKNGFTTSRASNEPEVIVIRSSGEPSSSRPPRTQNHQRHGTEVLEIEDLSPHPDVQVLQHPHVRVFQHPRHTEYDVPDVNVRQIEADEILARELQEQLYQEATLMRDEHIDENIARLLEQEENSSRASSSRASTRTNRSSNTNAANRGRRSRLEARLQQHSSRRRSNPPQARAPLRAPVRGPGQRLGRALDLNFPNNLSLETRLDLLEGLESLLGHTMNNSHLLHMDRDFTEDDYELLLALDENNHRHGGASTVRINNLPESIVQTDNFQETCVVCLETPTIGDTIRHLPCLHKFHKDCIDPWLGRSKSCPVCKSSVT